MSRDFWSKVAAQLTAAGIIAGFGFAWFVAQEFTTIKERLLRVEIALKVDVSKLADVR